MMKKMRRRRWSVAHGLLAMVGLAIAFAIFYPIVPQPAANITACLGNLKQLATGVQIYIADYDDRFPPETWTDATMPFTKNEDLLICTENIGRGGYGYAMNAAVVGQVYVQPEMNRMVLYFETDAKARNLIMNLAGRADAKHEERFSNVAYCDGSARTVEIGQRP